MIVAVACMCGGADGWIRSKLKKFGYAGALTIPIAKGKERAIAAARNLPSGPEEAELEAHIRNSSKFAIIIGTDGTNLRWVDVVNGTYLKNDVDAEFIIRDFGGQN